MKKTLTIVASCLLADLAGAQALNPTTTATGSSALPSPTPFAVVSLDANSAIWQRTTYEQAPGGRIVPHVHRYTELASGLNFFSGGQWIPSQEKIESYQGGAMARQGQYQVIFANNLNSAGSIDMQTPDGKRLRSNILGLMYHDTASDQAVLIAQIQNSKGELISSNQVLYPNAFKGVNADVRYTYKKGRFEQDVILREQPPSPESFGMNPETTELEVMTEFLNPPKATLTAGRMQKNGQTDQNVSWGATRLGRGRAFDLGETDNFKSDVSVIRQYVTVQGRTVLLEKVPIGAIRSGLQKLPLQASLNSKRPIVAFGMPALPPTPLPQTKPEPIKLAAATPANKGYVLDYVTLSSSLNGYTFQGDTTYYVSSFTTFTFPRAIIEGGTVIKFARGTGLDFMTDLFCNTSPYCPAVLTAKDDNTVGETISGSTGSPSGTYANYALVMECANNLTPIQNLRVMYANYGVIPFSLLIPDTIRNCQFINDTVAIVPQDKLTVENVLFNNVGMAFKSYWGDTTVNAAFVTAHNVNTLNTNSTLNITNSLFVCVTNFGASVSGSYNGTNSSDAGVFQTVGAGSHYLATNSLYRDAGTTNVDPNMLAGIATKTTYPPIVYFNDIFTTAQTFSPQAQRDTDIPDLGYHYDPLDYALGGCFANSNLTFTAGTAVGWFELSGTGGAGFGIALIDRVTVAFQGTATAPCVWARYDTVQEGNGNWATRGWLGGITCRFPGNSWEISAAPQVVANFTRCTGLSWDPNHFRDYWTPLIVRANNCEFFSANEGGYNLACYWTNCFVDRMSLGQVEGYEGNAIVLRNCTWHGGMLYLVPYNYPIPLSVRDCAFDGTTFTIQNYGLNTNNADYDYNAFTNNAPLFPVGGSHDVTNFTSFNWQAGPLGNYYLPTNSPLIDAGDVTADTVGLYHFTSQSNEAREGCSQVDIGYHYAAISCGEVNTDTIWMDDSAPTGATEYGTWNWISQDPNPISGALALQVDNCSAPSFYDATDTLTINSGDSLVAYAYLDPTNTPYVIQLDWWSDQYLYMGSAYWGNYGWGWGTYMGPVPEADQWVWLEVPANDVGLEGSVLNGMQLDSCGGKITWDRVGKHNGKNLCYDTDGDGIPDYIEDANGNGIVDPGETDFQNPDTDGDGLPDSVDADPVNYDHASPVFTITAPAENEVL